nr:GNAT family N-acetyltransferase [Thiomicrorhabdus marina]
MIQPICEQHKTLILVPVFDDADSAWHFADHSNLKHQLGSEYQHAVLDLNHGIHANSLGIISGLLQAGGILFVIAPPDWPEIANPLDQRFLNSPVQPHDCEPWFYRQLANVWQEQAIWLTQSDTKWQIKNTLDFSASEQAQQEHFSNGAATTEQNRAISKILKVAFGHSKRPLVLSADRGRGKSAALGLAAVQALLQGKQHIAISASLPEQTRSAFSVAQQWLQNSDDTEHLNIQKNQISFKYQNETKLLKFYAPDALLLNKIDCDLLLIDEAAQIPTPLLTSLLQNYHRTVFSTTLHGYEGSGRGFELRFTKTLNQLTPDWKRLHLKQPLRWNANDPLEQAINHSLLLDAENRITDEQPNLNEIEIRALKGAERMAYLPQLFALLVKAHYQTSPNDLQQLLNAPNQLLVALYQEQVVGVLLSQSEGGLRPEWLAENPNIHGHLVPQLLNRQYAYKDALSLQSWRLMRIAIEPEWQNVGIGSQLIKAWQDSARSQQIDFISSSFGASNDLIRFWLRQNMQPLHLGCKRDKASGSYNLVVYQALNNNTESLQQVAQQFYQQLPYLLSDELKQLPNDQLALIQQAKPQSLELIRDEDCLKITRQYLNLQRPFTTSGIFISQLWLSHCEMQLSEGVQNLLNDKLLKKMDWQELAKSYDLTGKKQAEQAFREHLKQLCQALEK